MDEKVLSKALTEVECKTFESLQVENLAHSTCTNRSVELCKIE